MDIPTALVTLLAASLVLLPRIPALSREGRAQARIRADADLWRAMPEGPARTQLAEAIESATLELLADRKSERFAERAVNRTIAWAAAAWVMLVISEVDVSSDVWWGHVRDALRIFGFLAGTIAALLFVATLGLGALHLVARGLEWLGSKRASRKRVG
ncbi:hypothetical protein OEB99_16635 [Actinotalea sp. M2MS4P-6]|uniref:hypothetical protein n=1 Tax=Actinotalea sp. M2MS4P-6 TaxID=2983762 RepID=UPI0021E3F6EC|nr:hypothetical protein [Actinotalea sp. M2MS4P-6]MCV2395944.1 hypothetical protein [Actinotalea sp. M2MS4P-6]